MAILYPGIDLAKNIFAPHASTPGAPSCCASPRLRAPGYTDSSPPWLCTIGIEPCSGAHH